MQPTTDINDFGHVNYIYKEIKEDSVSSLEEVKHKKQTKQHPLSLLQENNKVLGL